MSENCTKNPASPPPPAQRIQHEMIFLRLGNVMIIRFAVGVSYRFRINKKDMSEKCTRNPALPSAQISRKEILFLWLLIAMIIRFRVEISDRFRINEKYMPGKCTRNPASPHPPQTFQHDMIFLRNGNVPIIRFLFEKFCRFRIERNKYARNVLGTMPPPHAPKKINMKYFSKKWKCAVNPFLGRNFFSILK